MDRADPLWLPEEAWRLVHRAQTPEDRARALSTFRRSISTAAKQLGEVTPELTYRLAQLEDACWTLYDEQQDGHVRKAIRGLVSLRMAVEARLDARVTSEPITMRFVGYDGAVLATWEADADEVRRFYGVLPGADTDGIFVQLGWRERPDVQIADRASGNGLSHHGRA